MRIRTIKPEFWGSESIGRLSRDSRLLFIALLSFADDSGRGRGVFPALSGQLFPYDADAREKLPTWFSELEREGMVRRYKGPDGNTYYDIPNWLKHQKIEKPSAPKFPAFGEESGSIRVVVGEGSPLDQGSGIRDQGSGTVGRNGRSAGASPAADAEWVESLKVSPAYAGINVAVEFGKCAAWCEVHRKQNSRKRFINWLNRVDRPISTQPAKKYDDRPL